MHQLALVAVFFCSCTQPENKHEIIPPSTENTNRPVTIQKNESWAQEEDEPWIDSLKNIDTSTLAGKRQYILNHYLTETFHGDFERDTLFDLNYDGAKDYVLHVYGQCGTGIKAGVEVYLYDQKHRHYIHDSTLSAIRNPTFYIDKKKITGFYLGHGAGSGMKLEWKKGKWTCTKSFEVDNQMDSSKWIIHYPLTNQTETLIGPYQMIPPKELLETWYNLQ